jgi:hypothetical protein
MERGDMNRLKDHLCFAVRFVGLGYVVLWPVSTPGGGDLFGASLLCEGGGRALDIVCSLPHPLRLGVGLHLAGALCAVVAVLHLCVHGVCRMRGGRQDAVAASPDTCPAAVVAPATRKPRARRRPMPPPRKVVEPRTHFGLRGVPQ